MRLNQAILFLCCGLTAFAASPEPQHKTVPLAQAPAAVQKTIQTHLSGGKLDDIERVEDDGEVTYHVAVTKDGHDRDMVVAENGTLLSLGVALGETPAAVQKTIKAQAGMGKVDSIVKIFDDGEITCDVEMTTKAGASRSFSVAANGKLLQAQVALEETPAAVRKTIEAQVRQRKLGDIFRRFDDDEVYYDVQISDNGQDRDFSVLEEGKLATEQVFLPETPAVVRKTITSKIGDGKILRMDKVFAEDKLTYEIQGRKKGKRFDFSVSPQGAFLGMND